MKRIWRTLVLALALGCPAALFCGCAGMRPPEGVQAVERPMVVTAYCRCGKCCGWHRTWYGKPVITSGPHAGARKQVGVTASGAHAKVGTIAADTTRYPFGTVMYVPGYGYGRVEDRGTAIQGDHIDVFFRTHRQAVAWGRQRQVVKVWLPRDSGRQVAAGR